jgi:hypothetical protein
VRQFPEDPDLGQAVWGVEVPGAEEAELPGIEAVEAPNGGDLGGGGMGHLEAPGADDSKMASIVDTVNY